MSRAVAPERPRSVIPGWTRIAPRPEPALRARHSPSDDARRFERLVKHFGDYTQAIVLSAILHLLILLALAMWKVLAAPHAAGFVIVSSVVTGDDGAMPEVQTIIDAADSSEGGPAASESPAAGLELAAVRALPLPAGSTDDALAPGPSGVGAGTGGGGIGFFGTRAAGGSFVFVVDCSGSMQGPRFARALQELESAILQLSPRQRFYVFFYNGSAIPLFDPHPAAELLYASQERRVEARRWIHSRTAGGDTKPQEALRRALDMRPDVIFFLTDGEIPPESREVADRYNLAGTKIHTTGFTSRQGEETLKGIARDSGGTYRYIE